MTAWRASLHEATRRAIRTFAQSLAGALGLVELTLDRTWAVKLGYAVASAGTAAAIAFLMNIGEPGRGPES